MLLSAFGSALSLINSTVRTAALEAVPSSGSGAENVSNEPRSISWRTIAPGPKVPHPNEDLVDSSPSNRTIPRETGKAMSRRHVMPKEDEEHDTIITLVNGTPYRWERGYIHWYQMDDWYEDWPMTIHPGESINVHAKRRGGMSAVDSAAEVAYHLRGTSKPMSFMVQRRSFGRLDRDVNIHFLEDLQTKGNPKLSDHDLGFHVPPGGVNFVLAGKEGDFYSTSAPVAWMKSMWSDLKDLSLREIILPRSHHAGMWKVSGNYGPTNVHSSLTHEKDLRYQLETAGVRVLDFRPFISYIDGTTFASTGKILASHGTKIIEWWGLTGASLEEIILTINKFNEEHPGELIIFDIHHTSSMMQVKTYQVYEATADEHQLVYGALKKLKYRVSLPEGKDITKMPLREILGDKPSGVIIRVNNDWRICSDGKMSAMPGSHEGFVSSDFFPKNDRWSEKPHADQLIADQLGKLKEWRKHRKDRLLSADWILTKHWWQTIFPKQTVVDDSVEMYKLIYNQLWDDLTDEKYPNWIAVDGIDSSEIKDIVVAMNHCFVLRKCGSLGGRVKVKE
ncbi:hypothetical protein G7046_g6378 [Stylonectria norvegica]|nr:hypothetical protein G7046_g6378 [Stylonectria norvegica]